MPICTSPRTWRSAASRGSVTRCAGWRASPEAPLRGFHHWFTRVTPSDLASRTQTVWQYQPVPTLSRLLPPSPAIPGSGCLQLHQTAATARRWSPSISTRIHSASWRSQQLMPVPAGPRQPGHLDAQHDAHPPHRDLGDQPGKGRPGIGRRGRYPKVVVDHHDPRPRPTQPSAAARSASAYCSRVDSECSRTCCLLDWRTTAARSRCSGRIFSCGWPHGRYLPRLIAPATRRVSRRAGRQQRQPPPPPGAPPAAPSRPQVRSHCSPGARSHLAHLPHVSAEPPWPPLATALPRSVSPQVQVQRRRTVQFRWHQQWPIETAYLELKSSILGGRVLRARTPADISQEIYALLTTYQILRIAITDAIETTGGMDLDRGSFTIALNAARDQIVQATAVIAEDVIDLAGAIGRRVLDNLLPTRRLRVSPASSNARSPVPGPRPQHQPAQLQSHPQNQHPHPGRPLTASPPALSTRPCD